MIECAPIRQAAAMQMQSGVNNPMRVNLENIAIVLNEPHYPENIGAAARSAKNMGIRRLLVVNPLDFDLDRVLKMATHAARDVVEAMEIYDDLRNALAPFRHVVGTTARLGSRRQRVRNPRQMADELVSISRENEAAILFGTESSGLTNEQLRFCDFLVTIPTADFASINLAQAVMIVAYELYTANREEPQRFVPRLAARRELEGMYDQLRDTLARINFINQDNPDYWMLSVRRFFSRIGLRAGEVKIVRGICRKIDWYCDRKDEDGPASAPDGKHSPNR